MKTLNNTLFNENFMFNLIKFTFIGFIAITIILVSTEIFLNPENLSFGGF